MVLDSGKPVEMYVFLFDDLLLITRRKKGLGKKVGANWGLVIGIISGFRSNRR